MGAAAVEVPGIVKLKCSVKNYDWGKVGNESAVARLYAYNSGVKLNHTNPLGPYAELWIGTHESGPSYVVVSSSSSGVDNTNLVDLKDWIQQNPLVLGDKVLQKWVSNLPFLFKVLSLAKALSIQAHPDKDLALLLHNQPPLEFKDDNHKPEMALAITQFEALCGFVSLEELKDVVQNVPEIIELVGTVHADQVLHIGEQDEDKKLKEVSKSLFIELMSASKVVVSEVISKLAS